MNLFNISSPHNFPKITAQTDRKIKAKTYTFLLVPEESNGTTRIESQSCIVLSKIPLFVRNVQSTYQPTFHSTLPYLLVQLVCSRVFPIVLIPQAVLSVGDTTFLSGSRVQSLFHRFTILKFVLNVSTCFSRLQEGISNFM